MNSQTGALIPINAITKPALEASFRIAGWNSNLDELVEMVHRVADASGTPLPDAVGIEVKPGLNASVVTGEVDGLVQTGIFVTPEFVGEMLANKPDIAHAVIAHEIGHIALGHQGKKALRDIAEGRKPDAHKQEFDADAFVKSLGMGEALARSLEENCCEDPGCQCRTKDSEDHPAAAERIRRLRER